MRSSISIIPKNISLPSIKFCPEYSFYLLDRIDPLWSNIYFYASENSQMNLWDARGHILPQYPKTFPSTVQISSKNILPSFCSVQTFVKEVPARCTHLLRNLYGMLAPPNNLPTPNFTSSSASVWVLLPQQVSEPV